MQVSDFLFDVHSDTKLEEREIIEQFLQRLQYSFYTLQRNERPDFIARIDDKKIGIEVTKYYSDFTKKGSKMQRNLMYWKDFALKLKKKIEKTNPEFSCVYGAIHFKQTRFDTMSLLTDDCYVELIACINKSGILKKTESTIDLSEIESPLLSRHINRIYFENKGESTNFLWWDARLQSGEVFYDKEATLNIISKKEKSSLGYDCGFDQKWLIIFAAGLGLADIYSEYENKSSRQGRVFVMNFENKYYHLKSLTASSNYFTHIYIWDKFSEKIFQIIPYYKKIFDCDLKTIWVNHLPIKNDDKF